MGHIVNAKDEVYRILAERLNKNPVGTPINDTLMEILQRLYTESEAVVGGKFPLLPMKLDQIAGITGIKEDELKTILEGMADKGLVLDIPRKDTVYYMLAPMVVGFFEYTFMRVGSSANLREMAELFEKYFGGEEVRREFSGADTKIMRTLVYENLIPLAVETEVLSYERAAQIIRESGGGAISTCPCRHKASHLGKSCGAPIEVCTSLGAGAEWVVRRGMGKPATVDELLQVLDLTEKAGLVHNCDNVLNKPTYMCHCCGCCCVILRGIKETGHYTTHPSNFLPAVDPEACTGCGTCAESCHIGAITMDTEKDVPVINTQKCIGCGVCANACPSGALTMTRKPTLYVPPKDAKEKFLKIAMEKGRI